MFAMEKNLESAIKHIIVRKIIVMIILMIFLTIREPVIYVLADFVR